MNISNEVGAVLSTLAIDGKVARITEGQLDRKLYVKVNEVLEAIGGEWNRKLKGHVFESDPTIALDVAIESGSVDRPRDMDFFPTPSPLAIDMCKLACIKKGMLVLEPSAGEGVIALEAAKLGGAVTCVEANPKRAEILRSYSLGIDSVVEADFLSVLPRLSGPSGIKGLAAPWVFDAIVMNPPFSKRQDLAHVLHALKFLKPAGARASGRLVSVMSAGVTFRQDARTRAFRDTVRDNNGVITPLPDDTFRESGTSVRTVLVEMVAPGRK